MCDNKRCIKCNKEYYVTHVKITAVVYIDNFGNRVSRSNLYLCINCVPKLTEHEGISVGYVQI